VVWGVLEFEPSQLSVNKKSFDIEIDNLIVYRKKNAFQKRGFETNLNEKDQNAMLDILKIEPQAALAQSYYCLQ
jgi:serine/threonine-protein kinase HipA